MGMETGEENEEIVSEKENRIDILEEMRKSKLWLMCGGVESESG